ncbi:MAG: uroporphyrinogen decarboxylase family protein [Verrucomicrobiota bacterium]
MMRKFEPNYQYMIDAAYNREAERLPLYEHGFDVSIIEKIIGEMVRPLLFSDQFEDKVEAQRRVAKCGIQLGYDCIPFERCVTELIQGGQALMGHAPALIETMEDVEKYPWETKAQEYINRFDEDFRALREALPEGMKAVGGIGNGLFETMQDFVPFQELAFLQVDEPEVYELLWKKIGDLMMTLWKWLLENHADSFAVCRFGDDLGFRSSTLIQPNEIRRHIIPQYKRVVDLVHAHDKPFLLHSCGKIYDVMDDLIGVVGIDAKHSNEDAIDTFDVWVERYGKKIGNFGGIEMNIMTLNTPKEVKQYVRNLLEKIDGHGGIAIGTGNQISDYTEPANWIAMTDAVREWRGE